MAGTDPASLLAASNELQGYASNPNGLQLMEIVLWKDYLLSLNPMATTDPATLLKEVEAACSQCNAANPYSLSLIIIGLLKQIALTKNPSANVDPKSLMSDGNCFQCYAPNLYSFKLMELVLIKSLSGGSGGPCPQDMQVAWTPTNLKLGQMMGFSVFNSNPKLPGITSITFQQQTSTEGLDIEHCADIISISFPDLLTLTDGGYIDVEQCASLTSASAPLLTSSAGNVQFSNNAALASVNLNSLTTVATLGLAGIAVSTISLPALITANGILNASFDPNLTSISCPSLVTALQGISIDDCPLLTSASFPALVPTNGQNFDGSNSALDVTSVDLILHRHVLNAGYVSGQITLQGGTNAAPTSKAPGSDYAILIGRGVALTTN